MGVASANRSAAQNEGAQLVVVKGDDKEKAQKV